MTNLNITVEALEPETNFDAPDQATRAPREVLGFFAVIAFTFGCAASFVGGVALSVFL